MMPNPVSKSKYEVPNDKIIRKINEEIRIPVGVKIITKVTTSQTWFTVLCGIIVTLSVALTSSQYIELALLRSSMANLLEEVQQTRLELLNVQENMVQLQGKVNQMIHRPHSKIKRAAIDQMVMSSGKTFDNDEPQATVSVQSALDVITHFSTDSINITEVNSMDASNCNCTLSSIENKLVLNRTKRSNRRGNHSSTAPTPHRNKKNKKRGPVAVHFKGGLPERIIEDRGLIAPWFVDKNAVRELNFSNYILREGKGTVEITECGLYWVYAQVYYLTSEHQNSFTINLRKEGKPPHQLATCSINSCGDRSTSELSCFTAVVHYFSAGDQIFIHQRERKRRVILRDSFSFLGLVRLNSLQGKYC